MPVVNYWQYLVNVVKKRPLACFVMCCVLSQTFLQIAGVVTHACFATCFASMLTFHAAAKRLHSCANSICFCLLQRLKALFFILVSNIFVCVRGKFLKCPFWVGCLKTNTRTIMKIFEFVLFNLSRSLFYPERIKGSGLEWYIS